MWPYWLMFLLPAAFTITEVSRNGRTGDIRAWTLNARWNLILLLFVLLIGFRVEVGADWNQYLERLYMAETQSLLDSLQGKDPSFELLNHLSLRLGWGIYGTNFISASIFCIGLLSFCNAQPRPWLALLTAVPYLIIVVGMGYTRQSVALGLALIGLTVLERGATARFAAWVVVAATFHRSALLLLPIAALASSRNRWWTVTWISVVCALGYLLLIEEHMEALEYQYFDRELDSQGAYVRLVMNLIPAALALGRWRRFSSLCANPRLWLWFALISFALLILVFISPSSTAVDRIALYMLPMQLVVFARTPELISGKRGANTGWVMVLVLYYAAVQFVWLNFASHASAWLPYRFWLFESLPI